MAVRISRSLARLGFIGWRSMIEQLAAERQAIVHGTKSGSSGPGPGGRLAGGGDLAARAAADDDAIGGSGVGAAGSRHRPPAPLWPRQAVPCLGRLPARALPTPV